MPKIFFIYKVRGTGFHPLPSFNFLDVDCQHVRQSSQPLPSLPDLAPSLGPNCDTTREEARDAIFPASA